MTFRALLYLLALCLVPLLGACSSPRISMEVASLPNVNPDSSGRPAPIIVKMYEMRSDLAFRQGDFQTLFMEPMKVLGAELVAMDELLFVPGEARVVEYSPMPETRYVGILAGFRQMERAKWRTVLPVDPEAKNPIRIELNDTTLTVIDQDAEWSPEERIRTYEKPGETAGGEKTPEAAPAPAPTSAPARSPAPEEQKAPEDQPGPAASGYVLPRSRQIN